MNILIPDSWLKEHLKTKANSQKIGESLSLCSQSVEKISRIDDDFVYDIEITTNRPDCLSVYGLARELSAILPRFGLPAKLMPLETKQELNKIEKGLPLEVKIAKPSLCPRFTALVFDQVVIKPSPKIIVERLEKCGIRAINNVVDISNYLMLELNQPMHTFDYDKIKNHQMILRESAGGEKITTLDGQTRPLPDGTMIIEDGERRIIDLCGIMGGANSEVDEQTKKVLLFIQTYDPVKIRQTCQKMAFRTDAAARFEKGVNPQGVMIAMNQAIEMFEKNCQAQIAGNLIDIYPHPSKEKNIKLDINLVNKIMGIEINQKEIVSILESLGFSIINSKLSIIHCRIPHWRSADINIAEDLIEEIARIYGYHRLPNCLPPISFIPQEKIDLFSWEKKIKNALKFWGFTENISYSMISKSILQKTQTNSEDCLQINNPLSEEWIYLRTSLIPSLLEMAGKNPKTNLKIFEMSHVYFPQEEKQLPEEILMLTGLINHGDFQKAKGIAEGILSQMGILNFDFKDYSLQKTFYGKVFRPGHRAEIVCENKSLGFFGEIRKEILANFSLEGSFFIFDFDFKELVKLACSQKKYQPIPKYPPIIEDLSFVIPSKTYVNDIIKIIKKIGLIIKSVELLDSYRDTRTFRITYQDLNKTLTDKEVEKIRKDIIKRVGEKFKAKLKDKN